MTITKKIRQLRQKRVIRFAERCSEYGLSVKNVRFSPSCLFMVFRYRGLDYWYHFETDCLDVFRTSENSEGSRDVHVHFEPNLRSIASVVKYLKTV